MEIAITVMNNINNTLHPMTQAEYKNWYDDCVVDYAKDKEIALKISPAEALELSRGSFAKGLPDGLNTADNHFYSLINEQSKPVCSLWIALKTEWGTTKAFIYDITVAKGEKRKGYGEQTMLLLEAEAAKLGATQIDLHVFAHNEAARKLYEKVGYNVTDLSMSKTI